MSFSEESTEVKKINYRKSKKNVSKVITNYERKLMRVKAGRQPKITQSFKLELISTSNTSHSSTEDAAIYNLEGFREDLNFIDHVNDCLNRLDLEDRQIIWYSMFQNLPNIQVAEMVNTSYSNLLIKKRNAIELFAIALQCEVYFS
ncbi:ArpU family phage packaging/lysis transcriptional regulator [Globicatella sp. PHS-GS-PNBC-21-1553]|uniref:ArpU family phage packaging/lysis transcriptional regulator n=1 Tax=Globicatella sp. PHS-GS-PNBC-21-1553 TaxID=2885764 RepID=UPI00298F31E9|nr:ArpU family phage packaging/lysis transcriptional regulator [Globicatella sp. PHS-GS-PNBC-21-1553]WPC08771.1 hypothetical protein LB888_00500 [Globicatella sp. PHS-GS-PNBC-21-1553]